MIMVVIGGVAGMLFWLQMVFYRKLWNRSVEVKIAFNDMTVRAGEKTILTEIVENRKWLPLPALKVKFQCSGDLKFADDDSSVVTDMYYRNDLFSLMPFRRITRRHEIRCTKRGYFGIRGINLVGADLFLTREMLDIRQGETWIHVIPALYETEELQTAVQEISGEVLSKRHLQTDPFAYRGIREYTPTDEVKAVNWKASAKTGELKVNVYDYTSVSTVEIYMNLEDRRIIRQEEQVEKAISIAAYLAGEFLNLGIGVDLYANARDCISKNILCMEDNRDKGQLEHIYKVLARIDLRQETEVFEQCFEERLMNNTNRMRVFISPDGHKEFQDLLCNSLPKQRFIWICPCKKAENAEIRDELIEHTRLVPDRK